LSARRESAQHVRSGERRDECIGRPVDQLVRRRELAETPVDDHADLVRERRSVFEVVGDEDGWERELVQELLQLCADGAFRVCVERGERFVQQDDSWPACQRARECDALALAARECAWSCVGEMRDAEALEVLVGAFLARVGDVLADGEVREERVLLEDESDPAFVRLAEDPPLGVEPHVVAKRDDSA